MQNEIEIMRVLRVPPMGKLVVSFNGTRYEKISDITEANVRQLMQAAIGELITFVGGYQNLVDAGVAPPLAPPQASPTPSTTVESTDEEAQRFVNRMEAERDALKTSGPKPSPSLLTNLRRRPASTEASANKMLSLVEQVDAILQRHLLTDPELAARKIHLVQDAKGGLVIEVDGRRYERPREIDDPRIQAMIKRALQEWEAT
ncbi:MAG: hypothetical protein KC433_15685 [Anaerolineales bacterium]|nr:hypothetical protein [Anaerolineales bacterium]MCB8940160.1 hypothetical protein [Ardenticatenaceae bacterium]